MEEKVAEEERKQCNMQQLVESAYAQAVQEIDGEVSTTLRFCNLTCAQQLVPKCIKPRISASGFYEGHAPADDAVRKRRKVHHTST